MTCYDSDPKHPHQPRLGTKVLRSQVSEVLTGFPTVMFGGNKGMFMIWCEKFRCATIGGYMIYLIKFVCDANSICFMMWQDSPTMSHMRKSRPHGCFCHDSPQRHGDTKSAPSKRSKVHRQWLENPARLQKDQVVANHFIDVHSLMALSYLAK